MFIGLQRITTFTLSFYCTFAERACLDGLAPEVDVLLSNPVFSPSIYYCSWSLEELPVFGVGAESLGLPLLPLSTDPPVREEVNDCFPSPLFMNQVISDIFYNYTILNQ